MTALPSFFMHRCKCGPVVEPISRITTWVFVGIIRNTIYIFRTNSCNNRTLCYILTFIYDKCRRNMTIRNSNIIRFDCNSKTTSTIETSICNCSRSNSNNIRTVWSCNINTRMVGRCTLCRSISITKIWSNSSVTEE